MAVLLAPMYEIIRGPMAWCAFFVFNPLMAICTGLFHVCVFILPVFLLHHNSIMGQLWGLTLCPHVLSDRDTDLLCGVVFFCGSAKNLKARYVDRKPEICILCGST